MEWFAGFLIIFPSKLSNRWDFGNAMASPTKTKQALRGTINDLPSTDCGTLHLIRVMNRSFITNLYLSEFLSFFLLFCLFIVVNPAISSIKMRTYEVCFTRFNDLCKKDKKLIVKKRQI